ncbi:MAG: helix-turn-helix domain-containing protein [Lachnospiraceae bacterium]|nr:helix-turn-helix domain-containing protein [Lachnospiraceae bacterium]
MLTAQIVKNCLEELTSITRIEFCVQDPNGSVFARTSGAVTPSTELITGFAASAVDSQIIGDQYLLKVMEEDEVVYILTAIGAGDYTLMVAKIAVSELQNLLQAYKEKYDRNNFFQNLLLDNLLLVDIHNRAKKLHINFNVPRAVILVEINSVSDTNASDLLAGIFTIHNGDYLTEVDESSVIIIKSVDSMDDYAKVQEAAQIAVDMLNTEAMLKVRASFGMIVPDLKSISKSYKEAKMALDVGKIFYAEKSVSSYNELGIGRLIYQLPSNLCRVFINEVFGDHIPDDLDNETLSTINTFFENSLNVSETSRKLFIHRNTLVYRIEKLQKSTGLDIRIFDDAMTFKIALMVMNYLTYLDAKDY